MISTERLKENQLPPPFQFRWTEQERMTTFTHFLGQLVIRTPSTAYYKWGLTVAYQPTQRFSFRDISPAHIRVFFGEKLEIGLILEHHLLGLRLHQPLVWARRIKL